MLLDLFYLTWFDAITVTLPFLTVLLVHLLDVPKTTTTTKSTTTKSISFETAEIVTAAVTTAASATTTPTTNGKIQKQKSEHSSEDSSSPSPVNASPVTSARNSFNNGIIPLHQQPSIDSLSDDYHEDEDTLSLENLFPCDQTEIYASKKISFIIDELIQTEANYVNNLRKGIQNYGCLHERQDLPEALQGAERKQHLLGNIDEILALHEQQILPMMLRNQRDLKMLFDEFAAYFDNNCFYCYVIFTMNKRMSMQLRQEQREWLQNYQSEIKDKLGIDSFLVQPIQRLTRYPLLLQQFISEFYKSGISCKPVLMSVCKLETRMRRLLQVVNQAEEILNIDEISELNLHQQGYFHKSTEFDAYHHRSRKKYRAKVFLFDRCLICVEIRKRRLAYRQHYAWEYLDLQLNNSKSITVLLKQSSVTSASSSGGGSTHSSISSSSSLASASSGFKEEYEFSSPEAISVTQWMRCACKILETMRTETTPQNRFSLPMDLVLGVAFAIWLIWQYLY